MLGTFQLRFRTRARSSCGKILPCGAAARPLVQKIRKRLQKEHPRSSTSAKSLVGQAVKAKITNALVKKDVIRHTATECTSRDFSQQNITVNAEPLQQETCTYIKIRNDWKDVWPGSAPTQTNWQLHVHVHKSLFWLLQSMHITMKVIQHDCSWTMNRSRRIPYYTATQKNHMTAVLFFIKAHRKTSMYIFCSALLISDWHMSTTLSNNRKWQTLLLTKVGFACDENGWKSAQLYYNSRNTRPTQPTWMENNAQITHQGACEDQTCSSSCIFKPCIKNRIQQT